MIDLLNSLDTIEGKNDGFVQVSSDWLRNKHCWYNLLNFLRTRTSVLIMLVVCFLVVELAIGCENGCYRFESHCSQSCLRSAAVASYVSASGASDANDATVLWWGCTDTLPSSTIWRYRRRKNKFLIAVIPLQHLYRNDYNMSVDILWSRTLVSNVFVLFCMAWTNYLFGRKVSYEVWFLVWLSKTAF